MNCDIHLCKFFMGMAIGVLAGALGAVCICRSKHHHGGCCDKMAKKVEHAADCVADSMGL